MLTLVGPIDRTTTIADRWPVSLTAIWAARRVDTTLELRSGDSLALESDFSLLVSLGVRP
jgi:hypothetical protein